MMTGLKVWDRQGNLLTDITGRYPKLIHSLTIAERTNQTVSYTPPDGTELLVVPIYLGRNDESIQTTTATDEDDDDTYTYNLWRVDITKTKDGFTITTYNHHQKIVPIKIYWGYL